MTLPAAIFGIIASTLYGALFHLIRGGNLLRLVIYIILGWFGFWLGHFFAEFLSWEFLSVGPLHLGIATIFSWVFMLVGSWLTQVEVERRQE
jgi:hypothetical protein